MDFIPKDIQAYAEKYTSDEPESLSSLNRETYVNHLYPRMLSGHLQGRLLAILSSLVKPEKILEIGTYTGYSALCLAEGLLERGILHTIELNEENETTIRKYFNNSVYRDKIKLHFGNALDIIPTLEGMFDLVFLDADKENYVNYFELIISKVNSGGVILADNVLWNGKVTKAKETDKETMGIRAFNEIVKNDSRVENVLLTVRDGLMLILKK